MIFHYSFILNKLIFYPLIHLLYQKSLKNRHYSKLSHLLYLSRISLFPFIIIPLPTFISPFLSPSYQHYLNLLHFSILIKLFSLLSFNIIPIYPSSIIIKALSLFFLSLHQFIPLPIFIKLISLL